MAVCGMQASSVDLKHHDHDTVDIKCGDRDSGALHAYYSARSCNMPRLTVDWCAGGPQAKLMQLSSFITFDKFDAGSNPSMNLGLAGWQVFAAGGYNISEGPLPACEWTGVTCDNAGLPQSLNLSLASTNLSIFGRHSRCNCARGRALQPCLRKNITDAAL